MLGAMGSSKNIGTISHYMSTKKMYGRTGIATESDFAFDTGGSTGPNSQWQWDCWFRGANASAQNISMTIAVTYYCKFYKRINTIDTT